MPQGALEDGEVRGDRQGDGRGGGGGGGGDDVGRRKRPGDIPEVITARPKRAPVDVNRSRRMFAGLLGTLKKAQDESTKFAKSEVRASPLTSRLRPHASEGTIALHRAESFQDANPLD